MSEADEAGCPDYERYRQKALEIHAATCSDPGWCNYGEPEPPELADDVSLPWPERQERARLSLERTRHCMAAVRAENRAGETPRREEPPAEAVAEEVTETEWAVRWDDEEGGIVWYGPGDKGRTEAVSVARIYGYGTPESRVSVVHRTVTYGPWAADAATDGA